MALPFLFFLFLQVYSHHRGRKWNEELNVISIIQHIHVGPRLLHQPHALNLHVLVLICYTADFHRNGGGGVWEHLLKRDFFFHIKKKKKRQKASTAPKPWKVLRLTILSKWHKEAELIKLTSVIIFPLVLFLSLWLARFCFCCKTLSLVVRYSNANSLMILQNLFMFTSRIAYGGCPIKSKKEWNLQWKTTVAMDSVLRNKHQQSQNFP